MDPPIQEMASSALNMGEKLRSRRVVGVDPLAVLEGTKGVLHQG